MKKAKLESACPSMTTSAFPVRLRARITGTPAGVMLRMKTLAPSADQSTLNTGQSFRLTS